MREKVVTGVELMQGVGLTPAKGFWADAWSQVVVRRGAMVALAWLALVAFLAVFSPFLASGHPLILTRLDAAGAAVEVSSPFLRHLKPTDIALPVWTLAGAAYILAGPASSRGRRLAITLYAGLFLGVALIGSTLFQNRLFGSNPPDWARDLRYDARTRWVTALAAAGSCGLIAAALPVLGTIRRRFAVGAGILVLGGAAIFASWDRPRIELFPYPEQEAAGEVRATYTLIPFSPGQRYSELDRRPPGTRLGEALAHPDTSPTRDRAFIAGTDAFGQDVLTQTLHACRLAISIGFVSTGIAVTIGVTLGALAGYFGGWVDLFIQRLIEIFMSIPVLFLLIIASGVLPAEMRTTYVTMAIIGLVSWTGSARFTRAEFLKLRNQDFVQSARGMGLPLRSILFKHMLPNGVTPVLVEASFGIAAAIIAEATLSYLGLGPIDSASWGKLLSNATNAEGIFKWWLAIIPGMAIFLTVLSYNLIGEALRDAIDPKLKKARV